MLDKFILGGGTLGVENLGGDENTMKKKSILLTCIVAIMALAMFVGCDSTPVFPDMPKSVKGGYLTQTGVILTGQEVTADKFTLTVEYDNGDEPTVMPATNIQLDGTGNVFAVAGLDSDNNPVDTEKLLVAFTDANRIEATGFKESYTVAEAKAIKASDIQVKAYYGTDGVVDLTSSEFVVKVVDEDKLDTLVSPSNPTAQVEVVVRALVGVENANKDASNALDETYLITIDYAEPVETEYAIKSVDAVSFTPNFLIKALKYNEIPAPTFNDVIFTVTYDNGVTKDSVKLTEDSGVVLGYVDSTTGLDLAKKNLIGDTTTPYAVKAVYNDEVVPFAGDAKAPAKVFVKVEPVEGYTKPEFVAGEDVVAPVAEDFDVVLIVGGAYTRLDAAAKENVVLSYGTVAGEEFTSVNGKFDWASLYVKAEYMGESGVTDDYVATVAKAPVYGLAVSAAEDLKAPAKQQYNDIEAALALTAEDVSVLLTKDGKPVEVDPSKLTVAYSTSSTEFKAVTGDDLSDVNELYIYASYKDGDIVASNISENSVSLVAAKATDFEFNHKYQYVDSKNNPMYGATINYTVTTFNNLGTVEDNVAIGTVLEGITYTENGYVVTGLIDEVDATEHTYIVVATLSGTTTPVEKTITIKAGTGYYDVADLDAADIKFDMPARGSEISKNTRDYTIATENSWKSVGNPSADGKPAVTRVVTDFTGEKVALDGSSTADVVVSYLGADGKTAEKTITIEIPGYAWSDISKMELTYPDHPEVADGKLYAGVTYTYSSFELSGDVTYGENDDKAVITDCYVGKENLADKGTIELYSSQEPITFVVEYVAADGTPSTTTISLTLVANPEA